MTMLVTLLVLLPLLCAGQKIDVEFHAYLYRHEGTCHYEMVTWGTKEKRLFVMIVDQDTLEIDVRYITSSARKAHIDGYIPDTDAQYFIDLIIKKDYFTVIVTDDDQRTVYWLSTRACCRKKENPMISHGVVPGF